MLDRRLDAPGIDQRGRRSWTGRGLPGSRPPFSVADQVLRGFPGMDYVRQVVAIEIRPPWSRHRDLRATLSAPLVPPEDGAGGEQRDSAAAESPADAAQELSNT